ncbi:MAG: cupin domain-containing protein [Bdellovibrionales bacterium]
MDPINVDFKQRVVIDTQTKEWLGSPSNQVFRKPLERMFTESGHVTSIVKYERGSKFSEHEHPYGEEIYVLDGVFSDENGDYPKGTYLRNPPGSRHSPFSKEGCVLFVKLDQFSPKDSKEIRINTHSMTWLPGIGNLEVVPLHTFASENVALVKWPKGERFQKHTHFGGEEILVLSGEFRDEFGTYPELTWLRNPHLSKHSPFVVEETVIYVKTGHLLR